jgi:hypothetical protein
LADHDRLIADAREASTAVVERMGTELDTLIGRLARRHTGWFTRLWYESLLLAMLGVLFYRLAKNFFWDSWLAETPVPVAGIEFYLAALFWLALWCVILLWMFTMKLRRGLRREVDRLADGWREEPTSRGLFTRIERQCDRAVRFHDDVERLANEVHRLRDQLAQSGNDQLGRRDA